MKMNPLATLFLTAALSLASGSALAAAAGSQGTTNGTGNGDANAAAAAGMPAPDAHQNLAPKGVDNNDINTGGASSEPMTKDEMHKDSMCKDGRCPDVNKQTETGSENKSQ